MKFFHSLLLALTLVIGLTACEKIEVGNVGIKVNTLGDMRGVEKSPTVSGWVFYNPFSQDVVEFPTTVQTVSYAAEESSPINFVSKEGMTIGSDVSVSFHIDGALVPRLYSRFKQEDLEVLERTYLQRMIRDALNETGSKMSVYDIYGSGKSAFLDESKKFLEKNVNQDGFMIDQLTFSSPLRLPENVQKSIDNAITATQNAQVAQNKVKQFEAEAAQKKALAEGDAVKLRTEAQAAADALFLRSEADAKAILVRAEAQAKANELLQKSLTPALIESSKIQKWDGKLQPNFGGQGGMIIDLRTAREIAAQ